MSNGEVDPRLCCAARVCCHEPDARTATIEILKDGGLDDTQANSLADYMSAHGIVFFPVSVSQAITGMISTRKATGPGISEREKELRRALDQFAPPEGSNKSIL